MGTGIELSEVNSILLGCCVVSLLIVILSTVTTILVLRKCASLVELLHVESKRHTHELLTQNEKFNNQLFNQQERASLQQSATVRQLLDSFSIAASGKPLD